MFAHDLPCGDIECKGLAVSIEICSGSCPNVVAGDKARHDLGGGLVIYKLKWTTCGTLEAVKIQLKHIYMWYLSNTAE